MLKQYYPIPLLIVISFWPTTAQQTPALQERISQLDGVRRFPDGIYSGRFTRIHGGRIHSEDVIMIRKEGRILYRFISGGHPVAELFAQTANFSFHDFLRDRKVVYDTNQTDVELPDRGFPVFYLSFSNLESLFEPVSYNLSNAGGILDISTIAKPRRTLRVLLDSITNRPLRIDYYGANRILYRTLRLYYYDEIRIVRGDAKAGMNLADRIELIDLDSGVLYRLEFFSADLRIPEDAVFAAE